MLELLIVIIAFVVVFSFLVIIHEWGHFFAAIKCGVQVDEFGLGMPPKAKTIAKRGDTEYTLNWIPFGGFVRMLGQSDFDPAGDSKHDHNPKSFRNKHYLQKVLIVSAGVLMNFFAAFVLLMVVMGVGFKPLMVIPDHILGASIPSYITPTTSYVQEHPEIFQFAEVDGSTPTFITDVRPDSFAATAGLQIGDRIISINDTILTDQDAIGAFLEEHKGTPITFTVERINEAETGVETKILTVSTEKDTMIGIAFGQIPDLAPIQFPLHELPLRAGQELGNQMLITLTLAKQVFSGIFTKGEVSENISGPVGIASATGQVAKQGIIPLLILTIILSINLGIMNILPIPALDGGHLVTITASTLYRKLTGREPNPKIEAVIHGLGFMLLMLLILIVTWNDILRLLGN